MTTINRIQRIQQYDYNAIMKTGTKIFAISSAVLFASYLYFVGAVTFTVVHRRNIEEDLKTASSEVSKAELQYLLKDKGLTKEYALADGLVPPVQLTFTGPKNAVAWNTTR